MRILLIHNYYHYRGGEDIYVDSLKKLLKKKGNTVCFYSQKNQQNVGLIKRIKIYIGLFYNPSIDKEISELLSNFKPDIVHIHNVFYLIGFHILYHIKKRNIPIVFTIQNYKLLCPGGYLYKNGELCVHNQKGNFIKKLFSGCYQNSIISSFLLEIFQKYQQYVKLLTLIDVFVFTAKTVEDKHTSLLALVKRKTAILPYFIMPKQGRKMKNKKNYFLFVGRFSEEKGVKDLYQIAKKNRKIRFTFIGDGPLKSYLRKRKSQNIFIQDKVKYNSIFSYMKNALCTIIPSKWSETGPLVAFESFSAGTPVLAPDYGTFKEFIKEEQNGFFFKFNNRESLETKITQLWKKREKLEKLSSHCLETYKMHYTPDLHYTKLMKIYQLAREKNSFR